jgi:hypothetical protein
MFSAVNVLTRARQETKYTKMGSLIEDGKGHRIISLTFMSAFPFT